tara:strand:- start:663 stop:899 length:237 start_codon:yes stop_codon:yes gene_type:complete
MDQTIKVMAKMLNEQLSTATAVANGTVVRSGAGEGVSSLLTDSYPLLSMVAALPLFFARTHSGRLEGGAKERVRDVPS